MKKLIILFILLSSFVYAIEPSKPVSVTVNSVNMIVGDPITNGVNTCVPYDAAGLLACVNTFAFDGTTFTVPKAVKITPVATPPVTCNAGNEGALYSDTSHAFCWCDGTTWQKLSGAGTCA